MGAPVRLAHPVDTSWGWGLRWTTVLLLTVTLALPLSACGKKGKLTPPDGADYPKDYPTR